ncbi:MAG: TlpA family protein disulfide reductase [Gammaproteobacteria bacterium]|nr:TlpA family protein disulfide reductase [Gammaproteobacteria bacterium]
MKIIIIVLIAIAAAIGGFFLQQKQAPEETTLVTPPTRHTVSVVGQLRPDFTLPDIEDKQRNASEWDGKIRLVNFWATWCPPCLREMPAFIEMQEQFADKDFVVLGIAVDRKDAVETFLETMDINYPILVGDAAALELTTLYGNRLGVLPFSAFVGKDNKIISVHNGEITAETIKSILLSQNVK